MARHQYGIFAEGTRAHHHLELRLHPGAHDDDLTEAITAVRMANADHRTNGGVNLVLGFGPALWQRLSEGRPVPAVSDFPGYRNEALDLEAPATQGDLWVWVHGPSTDIVIDVVRAVTAALAPVAEVTLDLTGFVYHDSRDLTGFIDGSANPFLDDAPDAAVIALDQPGAGGCAAMTVQFVHDLELFEALPVAEQEQVFGRTKRDSVELEGDAKPADAHISRAEVEGDDGEELQVYRRSIPWATATAQGLHFVAFGADVDRFDRQLRRMYGLVDDGLVDRLLTYTTPLTGSFWFCPSVEDLELVGPLPDDDE